MPTHTLLFGERSLTTVAALFAEGRQARDAAARVVRDARLPEKRVEVVGPGDTAVERKLEPEASGIARTLVRAHVVMGTLGLLAGLLAGEALILAGVAWAAASPLFTVGLTSVFGALGGLMLGGLVSIRPDRSLLDVKVESAIQEGRWAVIVHPVNPSEEERAVDVLEQKSGGEVIRTL